MINGKNGKELLLNINLILIKKKKLDVLRELIRSFWGSCWIIKNLCQASLICLYSWYLMLPKLMQGPNSYCLACLRVLITSWIFYFGWWWNGIKYVFYKQISWLLYYAHHLSLLAYLSDSINSKTSPTLTGPFTFLIKCLLSAYLPVMSVTLTWVIPPLDPVLPRSWVTLALTGYDSMMFVDG